MKKILLIVVVFISNTLFSQNSNTQLQGTWQDIELPYSYEFNKESVRFVQSGYGVLMKYKLDTTQTPMWIDFTISRGRKMTLPGLLKWKSKDTLWIQQFPPFSKHPTEFDKDITSQSRKVHILVRKRK